jgi:ParB family transcriptional regulator, chromosome partitioning protein
MNLITVQIQAQTIPLCCFCNLKTKRRRTSRQTEIDKDHPLRHSGGMAKPALGRGLGALLGGAPIAKPSGTVAVLTAIQDTPVPETRERVQCVPLDRVRPCPLQPRKDFSEDALRELADSIKEQGIVQPLIVRERGGYLELIAGERRWRAARMLNLPEVPVILREADDRLVLELALIENLQREDLNPIEEAHGYAQLVQQFELTQEEVAVKVGKSRVAVTNSLRLLKLPPHVQGCVRDGRLSVGHAKVILGLSLEKQQQLATERILKEGLNVRQTEALVARLSKDSAVVKEVRSSPAIKDANVTNLETRLRERLGTKVQLRYTQGKGALEIHFFSDAELERLLQIIGVAVD